MSAYSLGDDHSDSSSMSNDDNEDTSETARQTSSRAGSGAMKFFDQGSQIIWVSRMTVAAIMFIAFVGIVATVFIVTRHEEEERFENEVSGSVENERKGSF
jgi:hypothetical protein